MNMAPKLKKSSYGPTAQIHFSYLSRQADGMVTEQILRSIFASYGEIVDIAIKKSSFDVHTKKQSGYGFIHFPLTIDGIKNAIRITMDVNQIYVNKVLYNCTITHNFRSIVDENKVTLQRYLSNVELSIVYLREIQFNTTPSQTSARNSSFLMEQERDRELLRHTNEKKWSNFPGSSSILDQPRNHTHNIYSGRSEPNLFTTYSPPSSSFFEPFPQSQCQFENSWKW